MGTRVIQMQQSHVMPEDLTELLEDLLMGRNISPLNMYEKYVVSTKKEGNAVVMEVDDATSYKITIERIS